MRAFKPDITLPLASLTLDNYFVLLVGILFILATTRCNFQGNLNAELVTDLEVDGRIRNNEHPYHTSRGKGSHPKLC